MDIFNLNCVMIMFKCLCGVVTLFMIGYWMKKFQKDEDVSQVQYISTHSMEDVIYPEMTICILEPFLIQAFEETLNINDYMEYLNGDGDHGEKYKSLSFPNVTINIFEYLEYINLWKLDNTMDRICCPGERNDHAIELRNSFNGLIEGYFAKCFSIGISPKFREPVGDIKIVFNQILTQVIEDMQNKEFDFERVYLFSNLRNQVSRFVDKAKSIWQVSSNKNMNVGVRIASTEILRRRNKRGDPCITNWKDYDNILMNEHIDRVGCSNPYLKQGKAICSNATKIKESRYDMNIIRRKFKPCQEMSNIEIQYIDKGISPAANATFSLWIEYSSDLKLITQAPSVDLHALIGNIGGYIGLFLGMSSTNFIFL